MADPDSTGHHNTGKLNRCSHFVKSVDVYGIPVGLTFNKEPQIKSTVGGYATIFSRLIVFLYLLMQCENVITQQYTLETSFIKRDLRTDTTVIELNNKTFDFAVKIDYILAAQFPDIAANLN